MPEKPKFTADQLKKILEITKQEVWPLPEVLAEKELRQQYEFQKQTLEKLGILETLTTGEKGIIGIDNKEYPIPTFEQITQRSKENKEVLKTKIEQGLVQILITPFGKKWNDLKDKYQQTILKHHQEGKLFATKKDPDDPNEELEPLDLDKNQPVWMWDKYDNADINGELVYFPKQFTKTNHQGLTKQQLLEGKKPVSWPSNLKFNQENPGWHISFIEPLPNIPRKNQGQTIGSRPQIDTKGASIKKYIKQGETTPCPSEYLQALQQEPIYQNEQGMTPEDQIIYALYYLEMHNQVIDDYDASRGGHGSISYQLGAYFPSSSDVPYADWNRDGRQASLGGHGPSARDGSCGVRPAVRV